MQTPVVVLTPINVYHVRSVDVYSFVVTSMFWCRIHGFAVARSEREKSDVSCRIEAPRSSSCSDRRFFHCMHTRTRIYKSIYKCVLT